jgi:hypothetical protein
VAGAHDEVDNPLGAIGDSILGRHFSMYSLIPLIDDNSDRTKDHTRLQPSDDHRACIHRFRPLRGISQRHRREGENRRLLADRSAVGKRAASLELQSAVIELTERIEEADSVALPVWDGGLAFTGPRMCGHDHRQPVFRVKSFQRAHQAG